MSLFYQNPFILVAILTILLSPFVLKFASKQNKDIKQQLKFIFLFILSAQVLLGFFNWENFSIGRSGYELSFSFPGSYLGFVFIISLLQIIFLFINKSLSTLAVALNFINTVLIFVAMSRLSSILGFQVVSFASIGTVFLVLIGNVVGLAFINKDKNILKKYMHQKGLSFIHLLVVAGIIVLGGILFFPKISPLLTEKVGQQLEQIAPTKISRNLAVENVKKLPEVQQYLKDVPKALVEVDNEDEGEYNIHVYEVKNGHTATFNWYRVSIKSGEVQSEFSFGMITGKICYPSEVLPKGRIEVKNIATGKLEYEDYPGSQDGGKNTYSMQLKPGDYYLRYNVKDQIFGYSTTVCPTGNETTCGETKQRILVKASVKTDQTISNYDLCDYYYKDSNAPKF